MSILEDLYNGKIYPMENIVPENPEYRAVSQEIADMRKYFAEKMSIEDREKFQQWNRLIHESCGMEAYENFSYGFRLATLLFMEVLRDYKISE